MEIFKSIKNRPSDDLSLFDKSVSAGVITICYKYKNFYKSFACHIWHVCAVLCVPALEPDAILTLPSDLIVEAMILFKHVFVCVE